MQMNREIKFRGWDKEHPNGAMMHDWNYLRTWTFKSVQESVILMQYTGLKDKNGVEIYEGDVVRISDDLIEVIHWVGDGQWMAEKQPLVGFVHHASIYKTPIEVIGNIYENPDLLN